MQNNLDARFAAGSNAGYQQCLARLRVPRAHHGTACKAQLAEQARSTAGGLS